MKSRLPLISLLVIFISASLFAQVPRTVLMEYATNASCPPCAAYNPDSYEYLTDHYDQMVSIWYHAWWPGPNDPMYLANIDENTNRISDYYNIIGVPRFVIDGVLSDYADNQTALVEHAETRLALDSPVKLKVDAVINGDSLEITVQVIVVASVTQSDVVLRTAVIEQMMIYESPPGNNGEKDFPHVFKKFCEGVGGIEIANFNVGDTLTFSMKEEMIPDWNPDQLAVVSFLQSDATKEVIQAGTNLKLHTLASEAPKMELIQKNQTINYEYSITNRQEEALNLRVSLDELANGETWENDLVYESTKQKSFEVSIEPEQSISFQLEIITDENPGYVNVEISAQNIGDETDYSATSEYLGLTYAGDILLMDSDGGQDYDSNFIRAFNKLGLEFTKIDSDILTEVGDMIDVENDFKTIFWNFANHTPTLDNYGISLSMDFLKAGGNIFYSGSEFAHDIHELQNMSIGKFFFRYYLDAKYISDSAGVSSLESTPDNILFSDVSIELNDIYSTPPDAIESGKGESAEIFQYSGTETYGMLILEKNEFKTAYMSFGLEQITSTDTQDMIIETVLDWFNSPVGVEGENKIEIPEIYSLSQNYPNPFNPTTVISYQIPESANVKLKVYDLLGNEIAELVNENKAAGFYSVEFDASEFSSGIYFYSITTGKFSKVNKMILVK